MGHKCLAVPSALTPAPILTSHDLTRSPDAHLHANTGIQFVVLSQNLGNLLETGTDIKKKGNQKKRQPQVEFILF